MYAFDRQYDNHEPVRPLQAAYEARRAELDAAGHYPYNDSFKGHLGAEFATDRDEEYAIYMLQKLHDIEELERKVEAFRAEGAEIIDTLDAVKRYRKVARVGWYVGGTGWAEFEDVRLVPRNGRPDVALPKGKRSHGFDVSSGTILGIPA